MENSATSSLLDGDNTDSTKGGWASSMYLIGAEVIERFSVSGTAGNLITYLTNVLHEPTATAAKELNIFNGAATLLPLFGAFIADAYFGRFKIILLSSLLYVVGLVMLTLSVWAVPLESQHVPFFLSLYLVGIGQGGHKPCLLTFGADQFDENNLEEQKARSRFFNWFFFGSCFGASVGTLIVFYVQENIGWAVGFTIPCLAMVMGLLIFLMGGNSYKQHIPSGSPLTRIMQVFVAAIRKRHLCLRKNDYGECYEQQSNVLVEVQPGVQTLPHTNQFKWLDKATIIDDIDEMSIIKNSWRLCTVTQVEEVKLLLRLLPVWLSCLMYGVVFAQQGTFYVKQGSTMDTSIGNNFHLSPASLQVFAILSALFFVPIYNNICIPLVRNFTGFQSAITMLQRIGFGMLLSTVSVGVAALVESTRIKIAGEYGLLDQPYTIVPMSVWWLLPQYMVSGVSNVFAVVGMQELFYDQMPNKIRCIGSAMQFSIFGVGSLISGILISIVQCFSSKAGDEWLINNLNRARLDHYYWLLTGLSTLGLCAFLCVASSFNYKRVDEDNSPPL